MTTLYISVFLFALFGKMGNKIFYYALFHVLGMLFVGALAYLSGNAQDFTAYMNEHGYTLFDSFKIDHNESILSMTRVYFYAAYEYLFRLPYYFIIKYLNPLWWLIYIVWMLAAINLNKQIDNIQ